MQLRRDLPLRTGRRSERQRGGTIVKAAGPHDRCRHVDVRMARIDRQVRPVDAIAIHLVLDGHAGRMGRYGPSGVVRPFEAQFAAVRIVRVDVVHVLREVVDRVAPGRRSAHPQLERRRGQLGKRRVHLHPSLRGFGKAESVADSLGCARGNTRRGRSRDKRERDQPASHDVFDGSCSACSM